MTNRLRILIVEDIEQDVELILYQLRKEEINFVHSHAKNKSEYIKSLNSFNADIILSDYNMPSFTGIDALQIAKENFSEIPFIIVTGSINEEIAVDCIKQGAWDYVIKEHIVRLVPALKNALKLKDQKLEKHKAQSKLIKSELKYRLIACNINDMISKHNLEGEFEFVSPSSYNLLGYEPNELTGRSIYDFSHPDDIEIIKANHSQII
ncbi:MAG: response regulator, partial [Bacteroidota bacterium]|nr:response regulator [Bacteroidota bacterium]